MLTLGIESSCDETACAVVKDGKHILSNIVTSQIDLHSMYGGVIPELACRRHIEVMLPIVERALSDASVTSKEIDQIAVAIGPGLIGALLLGIMTAKSLALAWKKPLVAVNHVKAHLYAPFMSLNTAPQFPCIGVVLSGGHTALLSIKGIADYTLISQTVDDAIGEAFDKVAKLLNLPYPGGPEVEKLAKQGNPTRYPFKVGTVKTNPLAFSFSGIKTAVLYAAKGQNGKQELHLSTSDKADIAASFQAMAFEDIVQKTLLATEIYGSQTVAFGGGVTNSQTLRSLFKQKAPHLNLLWPEPGLSLDNAAMIAGLAHHLPPSESPYELNPILSAF